VGLIGAAQQALRSGCTPLVLDQKLICAYNTPAVNAGCTFLDRLLSGLLVMVAAVDLFERG
jgi:hypothetical protein